MPAFRNCLPLLLNTLLTGYLCPTVDCNNGCQWGCIKDINGCDICRPDPCLVRFDYIISEMCIRMILQCVKVSNLKSNTYLQHIICSNAYI